MSSLARDNAQDDVHEKVTQARFLFGDFSGHLLNQEFDIDLDHMIDDQDNAVLFAFGRLDGIISDDGDHLEFEPAYAPLLCSRHDGKQLYIVGGDFQLKMDDPCYIVDIEYSTYRDGNFERYTHKFAPDAQPVLYCNTDGDELYIEDGRYTFTDRGIENK